MYVALLSSMLIMSLIVGVRYLAASGGFALLTARRFPALYSGRGRQIGAEIRASLVSAVIYGVPAGAVAWGWQRHGWSRIYTDGGAYPLWWLPGSVLTYLLIHDAYFYWTHRWMHRPSLFRAVHALHHAGSAPTAWTAMSFHPWESLSGAIFIPALVMVVPIHVCALLVVLLIMTVMGVTNHMGWEVFPRRLIDGPLGQWLITASHHQGHHQRYHCNFGLYFRHWDRLCRTDGGLGTFASDRRTRRAA